MANPPGARDSPAGAGVARSGAGAKTASAEDDFTPPPAIDIASHAPARAQVRSIVAGSGTSFFWAMRFMPKAKREAVFAVYAFCRTVDDIADGEGPAARKLEHLAAWRGEIDRLYLGRPVHPIARALARPVQTYDLAREDFVAVIEGMEMDAADRMVAPSMAELKLYCARVAGAVGLLSIRIFGIAGPASRTLALALGQALQLTNLLRDLSEDAARGRLYLPRDLLAAHGIMTRDPDAVLSHPALPAVCADLVTIARRLFADARTVLTACPRRAVRPAVVMMNVYRRLLDGLVRRGWTRLDEPVGVPAARKIWIALRYGLI